MRAMRPPSIQICAGPETIERPSKNRSQRRMMGSDLGVAGCASADAARSVRIAARRRRIRSGLRPHPVVEVFRLAARDRERLPAPAGEVLGQEDDLADVVGVMRELAVDGLDDRVRLAADRHRALQVRRLHRIDDIEENLPGRLPPLQERGARVGGRLFEFRVAVPVRLLAVGGEEIEPPRAEVAGDVLDHERDRIGFRVELLEELRLGDLSDGLFGEFLLPVKLPPRVFEIEVADHGRHSLRGSGGETGRRTRYSALDPAWYCSSLTFSIQSTVLPSSCSRTAMCVMAVAGVAPCQCFSPGGHQTTSPGRIFSIAPPQLCTRPQPSVTMRLWPSGCVCHAVRAPGSNVTRTASARAGAGVWNRGSTLTEPVKFSAGPLPEACEPLLWISIS